MKSNKKSIIGVVLSAVGLLASVIGLAYVMTLGGIFAIPLIFAGYFCIVALPFSVAGTVVCALERKKSKKSQVAFIGLVIGICAICATVCMLLAGAHSLTLNDFTSFQNAYIYNDGSYSEIASALFEGLHGDNWTF